LLIFPIKYVQVEGEAQGEENSIQKLLQDVDQGPRLAHVVKVEKNEIDTQEGEKNFVILR
jgi:acylphosphatase